MTFPYENSTLTQNLMKLTGGAPWLWAEILYTSCSRFSVPTLPPTPRFCFQHDIKASQHPCGSNCSCWSKWQWCAYHKTSWLRGVAQKSDDLTGNQNCDLPASNIVVLLGNEVIINYSSMNRQVPDFMDSGPFSSLHYHESNQDQIIAFHSELDAVFNPERDKSSHSWLKHSKENKFIVRLGVQTGM
jgi:hypothetical protein